DEGQSPFLHAALARGGIEPEVSVEGDRGAVARLDLLEEEGRHDGRPDDAERKAPGGEARVVGVEGDRDGIADPLVESPQDARTECDLVVAFWRAPFDDDRSSRTGLGREGNPASAADDNVRGTTRYRGARAGIT